MRFSRRATSFTAARDRAAAGSFRAAQAFKSRGAHNSAALQLGRFTRSLRIVSEAGRKGGRPGRSRGPRLRTTVAAELVVATAFPRAIKDAIK